MTRKQRNLLYLFIKTKIEPARQPHEYLATGSSFCALIENNFKTFSSKAITCISACICPNRATQTQIEWRPPRPWRRGAYLRCPPAYLLGSGEHLRVHLVYRMLPTRQSVHLHLPQHVHLRPLRPRQPVHPRRRLVRRFRPPRFHECLRPLLKCAQPPPRFRLDRPRPDRRVAVQRRPESLPADRTRLVLLSRH